LVKFVIGKNEKWYKKIKREIEEGGTRKRDQVREIRN